MSNQPNPADLEWLDEILDTHRSETWATGWNNDATEKAKAAISAKMQEREQSIWLRVNAAVGGINDNHSLGRNKLRAEIRQALPELTKRARGGDDE